MELFIRKRANQLLVLRKISKQDTKNSNFILRKKTIRLHQNDNFCSSKDALKEVIHVKILVIYISHTYRRIYISDKAFVSRIKNFYKSMKRLQSNKNEQIFEHVVH